MNSKTWHAGLALSVVLLLLAAANSFFQDSIVSSLSTTGGIPDRDRQIRPSSKTANPEFSSPKGNVCANISPAPKNWLTGDGLISDISDNYRIESEGATSFVAGKVGQAFSLNGTSDALIMSRTPGNVFTIEFWVQTTRTDGSGSYWDQGAFGIVTSSSGRDPGANFGVSLGAGRILFGTGYSYGFPSYRTIQSQPIADGQWHHVAATRGGGILKLYIDGALADQGASNLSNQIYSPFLIGNSATFVDSHFEGQLDELSIYKRELTASEIADIFLASTAGKCRQQFPFRLTLSPDTEDGTINGGQPATGRVTLTNGPAPIGGVTFDLSSSNASVANVPTTVVIAEGQSSALFQIDTTSVLRLTNATISVSSEGIQRSAGLKLLPSQAAAVYCSGFESGAGPEWNPTSTTTSPSGRKYYGLYSSVDGSRRMFGLANLPPHATVTISTDLYLEGSWQGLTSLIGPDLWNMFIFSNGNPYPDDSSELYSKVFSNYLGSSQGNFSNPEPAFSGAAEIKSLGYVTDSVYRVTHTFRDGNPTFALNFGTFTPDNWGLDNFCVWLDVDKEMSFTLVPPAVIRGEISVGRVALTSPAPVGGATFDLTSGDVSIAPVPGTITIPEGSREATFEIHTPGDISYPRSITINGTYNGETQSRKLRIEMPIGSLTISPNPISGGQIATGTLVLGGPAPVGGAIVDLVSADPTIATVPQSVVIPEGQTSTTFNVQTLLIPSQQTTTITASYRGYYSATNLTILKPLSGIGCYNNCQLLEGGTIVGTVYLNGPAPVGGATVNLISANPSAITVPAQITIPEGQNNVDFVLQGGSIPGEFADVAITANYAGDSETVSFRVTKLIARVSFTFPYVSGGQPINGTVSLNALAPTGGITVNLSDDQPTTASIPSSIYVPEGEYQVGIPVTTASVSTFTRVTITSIVNNFSTIAGGLIVMPPRMVYCDDFEGEPWGWSNYQLQTAPNGRKYLAAYPYSFITDFGQGLLPPHASLELSYDLLLLNVWQNDPWSISDYYSSNVFFSTTFSNSLVQSQFFPGSGPALFPGFTGAAESNSLGYAFPNSVYKMNTSVAHSGDYVLLRFAGAKQFGIDNLCVRLNSTLGTFSFDPPALSGNQSSTGTVSIAAPAPVGGIVVGLNSADPNSVIVPASVTIPEGATSASFTAQVSSSATASVVPIVAALNADSLTRGLVIINTLPDLSVNNLSAADNVVTTTAFNVQWQINNLGTGEANGTWDDKVYLSTDAQFGNDILLDQLTSSGPLPAGQIFSQQKDVTIPDGAITNDGTYYLIVVTDANDTVQEAGNNSNNIAIRPVFVRHALDLTVGQFNANPVSPAEAGSQIQLTAQVQNATSFPATFDALFYRGSASNILVGQQTGVSIGANTTVSVGTILDSTGVVGDQNLLVRIENANPPETSASNNTATISAYQIIDTINPETIIVNGPSEGQFIMPSPVSFTWSGTDAGTLTSQLGYQYRIDNGTWSQGAAATTTTITDLPEGAHTFEVRAIDQSNNIDQSPASRTFTIDGTAPIVSGISVSEITYNSARINWATNEPTIGKVQYAVRDGAFLFESQLTTVGASHSALLRNLGSNTPIKFRIVANDRANNQVVSAEGTFTTALFHNLAVRSEDVIFSNNAPAEGDLLTMSVVIRNNGDVSGTATVAFFDSVLGGTSFEISRQTLTVPAYSEGITITSQQFEAREGRRSLYAEILSTSPADDITNNHRALKDLLVGPPTARFSLTVSNPETWPGNQATFFAIVKNTGSQPRNLTGVQLTGVDWITPLSPLPASPLQPGEEYQFAFQMLTPANEPGGTTSNPILRSLSLGATGAPTEVFNFSVEIYDTPPSQIDVVIKDALTHEPISGASIALERVSRIWNTGQNGKPLDLSGNETLLDTHAGTQSIHVYAPGYAPNSIGIAPGPSGASVRSPATAMEVLLDRSLGLEIIDVQVTELSPEEVAARGIDVQDPVNNWVYDFVVMMEIGPLPIHNVVISRPGGGGATSASGSVGGGFSTQSGPPSYSWILTRSEYRDNWIIIPGEIRILKQFWEATIFVKNTSQATTLNNVRAALDVPAGLALPPLNGVPQPTIKELGSLGPGQVSGSAKWVIRGDVPGRYRLTGYASADGVATVNMQSREFEVAFPKITVSFDTPESVSAGSPFNLGISIRNDSPIALQLVKVRIKADRLHNCSLADAAEKTIGTIAPGATGSTSFTFISALTGYVIRVITYVSPAPVDTGVGVEPFCPVNPSKHLTGNESSRSLDNCPCRVTTTYFLQKQGSGYVTGNPAANGGGQMIFPDRPTWDAQGDFSVIQVKAITNCPGTMVHFRSFDIDDPTTNDTPVDLNGGDAIDNREAPPNKRGHFASGTNISTTAAAATADATTDETGVAVVDFQTTMFPGDNFKVGAGVNAGEVNALNDNSPSVNSKARSDGDVRFTLPLYVWRRINIERDSMSKVAATGGSNAPNHVEGIVTGEVVSYSGKNRFVAGWYVDVDTSPNQLPDGEDMGSVGAPNRFRGGSIVVGGTTYKIGGSIIDLTSGFANRLAVFIPNPPGLPSNQRATLVDDDDVNSRGIVDGDEGGGGQFFGFPTHSFDLLQPSPDKSVNVLAPAYIQPNYSTLGSFASSVGFKLNVNDSELLAQLSSGNVAFSKGTSDFWTAYFQAGYQGPKDESGDGVFRVIANNPRHFYKWTRGTTFAPSEGHNPNCALGGSGLGAMIFSETIRDYNTTFHQNHAPVTVAHELGHILGLPHNGDDGKKVVPADDYGIMTYGSVNHTFHPLDYSIFRSRVFSPGTGIAPCTSPGLVIGKFFATDQFQQQVMDEHYTNSQRVKPHSVIDEQVRLSSNLDVGFGNGGKILTDFNGNRDLSYGMAIQADGYIVIAGDTSNAPNSNFGLVRYTPDGALDPTFGNGGKVVVSIGNGVDRANEVVIQPDGKIIVAGSTGNGQEADFAVARFNSDGSLDTTFGTGGKVLTDFAADDDQAYSLALQTDGKIIAVGYATQDNTRSVALVRYTTNGILDTTFGSGGGLISRFSGNDAARDVALQSDGKILVGVEASTYYGNFVVLRYTAQGLLDTSFGNDGVAATDFGGSFETVTGIAIQDNGNIVAVGHSGDLVDRNFVMAKFDQAGLLDQSFGMDGRVTASFTAGHNEANDVVIGPGGIIYVSGDSISGATSVFTTLSYIPDGTLNPAFGNAGLLITPFGPGNSHLIVSKMQSDGKLLVAGSNDNGTNFDFAVARYDSLPAISGIVTYGNSQLPGPVTRYVPGVLVNASGSPPIFNTTDASGVYSLTGFGLGSYINTPTKSGGVNGSITSFDAALVAQHVVGPPLPHLSGNGLAVADVTANGEISSLDAAMIASYAVSAPRTGLAGNWIFSPVNRAFSSITSNITGQDYTALLMGEVSGNWGNPSSFRRANGPERSVSVRAPTLTATAKGSEIKIPITISGAANKGIIAYEFELRYDPSVITPMTNPIDLVNTASSRLSFAINANEKGLLRVSVYGPVPINDNGILLKLKFVTVGKPSSFSSLVFERILLNEGDPAVIATDGRIELVAKGD